MNDDRRTSLSDDARNLLAQHMPSLEQSLERRWTSRAMWCAHLSKFAECIHENPSNVLISVRPLHRSSPCTFMTIQSDVLKSVRALPYRTDPYERTKVCALLASP